MLEKGQIQIYTGQGKGKSTAAFGLALRAAGHNAKVLIYQFLKPPNLCLGERNAIKKIDKITLKVLEQPWDMRKSLEDPSLLEKVKSSISQALAECETAAHESYYDMIILDEINFCYSKKLVSIESIVKLLENRNDKVEIVLTGQGADEKLIEKADLVTKMECIKHPFEKGIKARRGIEY
jgi:cob(I)alamin adenosyltransferase